MPTRTVTKHDFLTVLGCKTRAWFGMRDSGSAPTPADLLRMQEGQDVHRRAQSLHPNGVFAGSIEKTKRLILDHAVKVEPAGGLKGGKRETKYSNSSSIKN